jgi:hypothetical protein
MNLREKLLSFIQTLYPSTNIFFVSVWWKANGHGSNRRLAEMLYSLERRGQIDIDTVALRILVKERTHDNPERSEDQK